MARICRTQFNDRFVSLSEEANARGDKNFCAPLALALLSGKSVEESTFALSQFGRKMRSGAMDHEILRAADLLGLKLTRVDHMDFVRSYPRPHCDVLKNMTTHHPRRFPHCFDPNKKYLLWVSRHVCAMIGGEVLDWSVNAALRVYKMHEVTAK